MTDLTIKATATILAIIFLSSIIMLFYTNTLLWAIPATITFIMLGRSK